MLEKLKGSKILPRMALACAAVTCPDAVRAETFDALADYSLGEDAVSTTGGPDFTTSSSTALMNGVTTFTPTESTTYDRTLINVTRVLGNVRLAPLWSLRWAVDAQLAMRVEETKEEPRTISRENWVEAKPRLEFTYTTQSKLEVFGGASYLIIPRYERNTTSVDVETATSYSQAALIVPHIGIVKRAGSFDGGFFYKLNAEKSREVRKVNNKEQSAFTFRDKIHDPTTMAIFARFRLGTFRLFGEFAAVQAGEGGNLTDDGDTVREDYMRARLEAAFPLWQAGLGSEVALVHKTLSYADNRNVTITTMPMTALHWKLVLGTPERNSFLGLVYVNGRDGQSLPEFNARYKLDGYGGSAGLTLGF